ncbi:MAG: uncharacterized protein QOG23_1961 [Blastocatellia bacterium]|nr:uncharacterized protein [Blastocatellia bacterium]
MLHQISFYDPPISLYAPPISLYERTHTPPKRKLGYYAMPLLWRDQVIGWGNLSVKNGELKSELGYVATQPRERAFKRELEAELDRMRDFLNLAS